MSTVTCSRKRQWPKQLAILASFQNEFPLDNQHETMIAILLALCCKYNTIHIFEQNFQAPFEAQGPTKSCLQYHEHFVKNTTTSHFLSKISQHFSRARGATKPCLRYCKHFVARITPPKFPSKVSKNLSKPEAQPKVGHNIASILLQIQPHPNF